MIEVRSAGVGGLEGYPASEHAISVCAEENIDISDHRSQEDTSELLKRSQIVLALARNHFDFLRGVYPEYHENIFLLKSFDYKNGKLRQISIADPIGEDFDFYKKVFAEIKREVGRILPRLLKLADWFHEKSDVLKPNSGKSGKKDQPGDLKKDI